MILIHEFCRYRKLKPDVVQIDGMHVPQTMKGRGVSNVLAREMLDHMTSQNIYVDVHCPVTREYIRNNQYAQYVRSMVNPNILKQRCKTTMF